MEFIKEWITNIILFVLLATVIDMLLPSSKLQKYTKMVTGLLLIVIILTPILKLVSNDFEEALATVPVFEASEENNMENLIELQKKEIQASNDAYILEQIAANLQSDAEEELMKQYGLEITSIEVLVDENSLDNFPENLQKVMVQLDQRSTDLNGPEGMEAVEVIKTVDISTDMPPASNKETNNSAQITSLLSQKWNVDEQTIEVLLEGGTANKDG